MALIDSQGIAAQLAAGDAGSAADKGEALEAVVAQTLCAMEGIGLIKRRIINSAGSAEIDILLYNHRHPSGLPFLPDYIMIECKNWQSAVNTATVRAFTSKLMECRLDFGILVAANGITGDAQDRTAAQAHLRAVFDRDRLKVIVVTRSELEGLQTTDELGALLRGKFGDCIMGVDTL